MSALLVLGLSLVGTVVGAHAKGDNLRDALVRAIGAACGFLFFTLLAALAVVHLLGWVWGAQAAGVTLSAAERALDLIQAWREQMLGAWDWKLGVAIILLAIGGFLYAAVNDADARKHRRAVEAETIKAHIRVSGRAPAKAPEPFNPFRLPLAGARFVRNAAAVLSIIASLAIATVSAKAPLQALEVRFEQSRSDILASALRARVVIEQELIVAAMSEAEAAAAETCSQTNATCATYRDFIVARPDALIANEPELRALWFGKGVPPAPAMMAERQDALVVPVAGSAEARTKYDLATLAAGVEEQTRAAREARTEYAEAIDSALIGIASSAGEEAFVQAASEAGATGEMIEALATPLFSDVLNESIGTLMEEAVRSVLGGSTLADVLANQFRPAMRALLRTPPGRAAARDAGVRAGAVLARTRAQSDAIIMRREAELARQRAAWAHANSQASQSAGNGIGVGNSPVFQPPYMPEFQRNWVFVPTPRPFTPYRPGPVFRGR